MGDLQRTLHKVGRLRGAAMGRASALRIAALDAVDENATADETMLRSVLRDLAEAHEAELRIVGLLDAAHVECEERLAIDAQREAA